ncbi:NADH-ubiquinone oxidoreductase-F iron-sulfur binding region domain-containing protein [Streptomyces sp. WM6386]|uniref:NADH-ubiquinone oxidoreductase-F iron-sulfur binding region domain-containing protein n=1 Tax=Streptomyces sp. WM6386 TaxID=1415558 RepID=UPI000619C6AC|nr:NADH-ubiquinone oxidoreductase-F iron-sulfur binding region domain-containing protein [Streptomyces sp. WM6386]KKD08236.1 NADH dehydrogenase [Streptomyces sp. WM6386]
MDLHFGDSEPTDDERAAVDELLGPPSSFWEGGERTEADLRWSRGGRTTRARRDLLLPGLHALNHRVGWISEGALAYLCRRLTVPPAQAYGVATSYGHFSVRPRPATVLRVCTDLVCAAAGAAELCAGIEARLGPDSGVDVERGACLGLCERAPAALVVRAGDPVRTAVSAPATVPAAVLAAVSPDSAPEEPPAADAVPQAGGASLTLLRRVGVADPSSPDDYRAHGGYAALRRAYELGPAGVLREITDAGPVGRGVAFPAGRTWLDVASRPDHPHHLVCNADESGPGAFGSRVIMEGDPYALVEAMTIAAYAIGAHTGYLYLRDAYPRAIHRMQCAVDRGRARGLLGDDILGRGHAFDIEIRRGAGAYVCGEDTALFNAIEGLRAEPRPTPPHPAEKGLFGGPTVVEDVETLIRVLPVLTRDEPAYAAAGAGRPVGTRLFCVSGSVDRPGVYELPFDTTPGEVLALAGVREGLRAVLLGGAAGAFAGPDELDVPLPLDGTREAGTARGSGVVMAFDDTVPLPRLVLRIAEFFRAESCGSCVPCRIGTVRQEEALRRIVERAGAAAADDLALLRDVGRAMRDASLCGVGRSAGNAVESAVDRLGVQA